MKIKKRLLSIFLVICSIMGMAPIAYASESHADMSSWLLSECRYSEEENCFVLTEDYTSWDTGSIWYNTPCEDDFILDLDYYTGSSNRILGGADGIVIAFYADYSYKMVGGEELGFNGSLGYGIELDTFYNGGRGDPSYNHIALIKEDVGNHLVTASLPESEDEQWHHLQLVVKDNTCTAYVDGTEKLSHAIEKTGYGWIGITSATGDGENRHAVKNIVVTGENTDVIDSKYLDVQLSHEKLSDENGTYTYKISANITNKAQATAPNMTAKLSCDEPLTLAEGVSAEISVGDLAPGTSKTVSWSVYAAWPTESRAVFFSVTADIDNAAASLQQESYIYLQAKNEQDTPSFEESEGIQSHKEEYINQHIEYYNESYNADVLPMESLRDLQYVMDDIEHDLSTAIYKGLSIATATSETVENFINLSSYIEIDTENVKFSFKIPDEVITDIGHSEYEAIIYQLMASDSVYKGILETFSTEYSDSVRGFAKEIAKNVETLAKPEVQANETKMNDLQTKINAIADTIGTADASSPAFAQAVEQFEALTEEQLDVSRTKSFLNNLTGASNVGLTFVGQILDGINSIGEAYQYACWAQSYAKTSSAFKTVLSTLRDAAYARAWGASGAGPAGDEGTLIAYSDANMYMGLYQAIDSFVETMEAYQEDTHREFVRQVSDAAVGNAAKIIVDTMQDVALDKLGGAVCPQLEAINMALTSGKLLVDLFTGIDDEYKLALAVQSLNHISTLLVDISNAYGRDLVDLNKMDSYIDLSGVIAEEKPVTASMKFDASVLFCKSIQMYKHSIMLACEYGMKYIEDKESTSETSNAITFLSKQKLVTSEIECHDSTLDQIVFNDVPQGSYYSDAIGWAVNKGIASGTSDSTFSPDATCTRAQAVTFLWRASGSPKVEDVKNSFVDVPEDSYYHDAVLWAVSEGITSGTSTNTFSPDEQCTRGQIVTMMYRDAGSPTVQAGSGNFRDVEQNAFYSPAVNWAVSESVTSGTAEDRFGPNDACTRAQILTFLYRDRY